MFQIPLVESSTIKTFVNEHIQVEKLEDDRPTFNYCIIFKNDSWVIIKNVYDINTFGDFKFLKLYCVDKDKGEHFHLINVDEIKSVGRND